ncbi:MAG: hypothetical protein V4696_00660 [Pseudomonadota bacterium]
MTAQIIPSAHRFTRKPAPRLVVVQPLTDQRKDELVRQWLGSDDHP